MKNVSSPIEANGKSLAYSTFFHIFLLVTVVTGSCLKWTVNTLTCGVTRKDMKKSHRGTKHGRNNFQTTLVEENLSGCSYKIITLSHNSCWHLSTVCHWSNCLLSDGFFSPWRSNFYTLQTLLHISNVDSTSRKGVANNRREPLIQRVCAGSSALS